MCLSSASFVSQSFMCEIPSKFRKTAPPSSVLVWAAKSTFFSLNLLSSSYTNLCFRSHAVPIWDHDLGIFTMVTTGFTSDAIFQYVTKKKVWQKRCDLIEASCGSQKLCQAELRTNFSWQYPSAQIDGSNCVGITVFSCSQLHTWLDPGSCTRTRCTLLPSSGLTASTIAMVPFSYRSTFFTRSMSRYSCRYPNLDTSDFYRTEVPSKSIVF